METNRPDFESLRNLLQNAPLYKKERINSDFAINPLLMEDFGFPFECECQLSPQTHLLKFQDKTVLEMEINAASLNLDGAGRKRRYAEYNDNGKIGQRFVEKVVGECQSCKSRKAIFLIEFFTEKEVGGEDFFYAKKLGQDPAFSIKPEAFVKKILKPGNLELYKKALMNLSSNFGIGAFAYFRRIVETELLSLLEQVASLKTPESAEIVVLLEKHKSQHIIPDLLEEVFKYLPESLKGLGHNPFKLLYGTLSVGIHQMTEDECFEKATSLKFVLDFVLKKIYEEKNEVSKVREHIKNLT